MTILKYNLFGPKWSDYSENWQTLLAILNGGNEIKTVLNVGVGDFRQDGHLACRAWNSLLKNEITSVESIINLEIDKKWYDVAKNTDDLLINNIVHGDVRTFVLENIDLIFWSHGPEHIFREEWQETFIRLENMAKCYVILQMPGGTGYDYSPVHVSKNIQRGELESFGYTVMYDGVWDTIACGILAYKNLKL